MCRGSLAGAAAGASICSAGGLVNEEGPDACRRATAQRRQQLERRAILRREHLHALASELAHEQAATDVAHRGGPAELARLGAL